MTGNAQAYELLMVGVGLLVADTGTIQDRLRSALLEFHELEASDFSSEETRHKFAYLMKALGVDNAGRDQVGASLDRLSDDEAMQYARRVYDLFLDTARDYFRKG
ncbi:hypothetical protein [Emcibacter sp. SYSU 3D8]|uniref:hypothetical protein n=1 Tax=Emcibacter sp. SYSU 3D8 TaxID=3133969 RepID=UPI0031FE9120